MAKTVSKNNFEDSITQLDKLVSEMESGDMPLERSLELFEKGINLTNECQKLLSEAELKIETLSQKSTSKNNNQITGVENEQ
ncbi:MAG: exodeoxyribonuclease VII small subunit [Gammaproteobacteria bacterium]|nr:MAG: exodeoxyribonuclease VII small subunit [Gammaproteobacteria bacterium]